MCHSIPTTAKFGTKDDIYVGFVWHAKFDPDRRRVTGTEAPDLRTGFMSRYYDGSFASRRRDNKPCEFLARKEKWRAGTSARFWLGVQCPLVA